MNKNVREIVTGLFRERQDFREIDLNDDYFDLGISSLTIVELQIKIEDALDVTMPTSQLMRLSCINDWVEAYSKHIDRERAVQG